MIKSMVANSAASSPHPDDPSLRIQHVTPVDGNGLPATGGTHAYGYDGNGNLTTDTWTVGGNVYQKIYGYTGNGLAGESDWVKQ